MDLETIVRRCPRRGCEALEVENNWTTLDALKKSSRHLAALNSRIAEKVCARIRSFET